MNVHTHAGFVGTGLFRRILICAGCLFCSGLLGCDLLNQSADEQAGGPGVTAFTNAPSGLRMRATPQLEGETLAIISPGEAVQVLGRVGDEFQAAGKAGRWAHIRWNNQEGYVFDAFLSGEPMSRMEVQARSIFSGRWRGEDHCAEGPTELSLSQDFTFFGRVFGGGDIARCFCGEISGTWRVEEDRVCFHVTTAPQFSIQADRYQDSCYKLDQERLMAVSNPFVQNFGSQTMEGLLRAE